MLVPISIGRFESALRQAPDLSVFFFSFFLFAYLPRPHLKITASVHDPSKVISG